jgi:sterol 3beta-glucosyltransferase
VRLTLVAVGTRGDVQPLLALGAGLSAGGHCVRLATHPVFEPEARACGLEFASLGINPQDLLQRAGTRAIAGMGGNSLQFLRSVLRAFAEGRSFMGEMLHRIYLACDEAQAIVYSSAAFPAVHAAQSLGVPCAMAAQQPFVPSKRLAAPILPGAGSVRLPAGALQSRYNRLSYFLVEQLLWQPWRSVINRWRKDELGLPAAPFRGLYPGASSGPSAVLHGYSPLVAPAPDDWPGWAHVTGYWFAETVAGWNPPESLERFLAQGPAPVVIGFGSMPLEPDLTYRVRQAVAIVGCRAVLLEGWGGLGAGEAVKLDPGVLRLPWVPHAWLLPRAAAVVHHGGSGTTGAGLRAGIPAVVVPFTGDQLFWAERLHALGLSPAPIGCRGLTADSLAAAIGTCLDDMSMRQRSAGFGQMVRDEDGVGVAVGLLEQYLRR